MLLTEGNRYASCEYKMAHVSPCKKNRGKKIKSSKLRYFRRIFEKKKFNQNYQKYRNYDYIKFQICFHPKIW